MVLSGASPLVFEGATDDASETTLAFVDPTTDRTITFPNATGTIVLEATGSTLTNKSIDLGNNTISGSLAEFNTALQDDSFAVIHNPAVLGQYYQRGLHYSSVNRFNLLNQRFFSFVTPLYKMTAAVAYQQYSVPNLLNTDSLGNTVGNMTFSGSQWVFSLGSSFKDLSLFFHRPI